MDNVVRDNGIGKIASTFVSKRKSWLEVALEIIFYGSPFIITIVNIGKYFRERIMVIILRILKNFNHLMKVLIVGFHDFPK